MKAQTFQQVGSDDALESRREIAQRLHCHPRTIARAEARGELVPIKFNSRFVRYRRSDTDRWIKNAEVGFATNLASQDPSHPFSNIRPELGARDGVSVSNAEPATLPPSGDGRAQYQQTVPRDPYQENAVRLH